MFDISASFWSKKQHAKKDCGVQYCKQFTVVIYDSNTARAGTCLQNTLNRIQGANCTLLGQGIKFGRKLFIRLVPEVIGS